MYLKDCPTVTLYNDFKNMITITVSFVDIEANIGKMRETLKSDLGRDRKRLKFFVRLEFSRKTLFLKALRNFSRHCMILF